MIFRSREFMMFSAPSLEVSNNRYAFPRYGIAGIVVMILAEGGLFSGISFVGIYFTPIVWTGYILFVDALVYSYRGKSFMKTRTREFALMLPWSIICWLVFEAYNLRLQNWHYRGLPENTMLRLLGYGWSFATIFPAVLITAEFIRLKLRFLPPKQQIPLSSSLLSFLIVVGAAMLLIPLLVSQETSTKLFGLVWVGFILLLDPINYLRGRESLLQDLSQGNPNRLYALLLSGLVCGVLWEFWNYWAIAKWEYSVPISFVGPKLFEMPLLGYAGFLPFAVECFVMNEFLYTLVPRLAPRS